MLAARFSRAAAALLIAIGVAGAAVIASPARAADPGPTTVAVIAPIVAPPGTTGVIDSALLEQYTGPEGLLTRQLDGVVGRPVTLAIDPMILASIRLLGTSAPPTATAWLERLRLAPNESFLLSYADADLTLALHAGASSVLTPISFDFAVDPGRFGPAASPSPTPSATANPNGPMPLPTTADLLAWDASLPNVAWPRAASVRGGDLEALGAAGFETMILSSGNVQRDASVGPVVTVSGYDAIVTDDAVSTTLSAAATTLSGEGLEASLPALREAISAASIGQNGRAVVVAHLDRAVALSGSNIAQVIAALQADTTVSLVPLSVAIAASTPATASIVDGPTDDERVAVARSLLEAEQAEQRFATIAADPERLTAPRRLALLALSDIAWMGNQAGWSTATADFLTVSDDILDSVQISTSSPFTLLADSATLPIPVSNDLNQAVTVYVTVRPETGQLAVTDSLVELTIEPNAQGKASVPVQAISNGRVQVLMTLTGASGVSVGQPAITEINVQAGWETPIVLAIGGLIVVVFAGGLIRNIVRRRSTATEADVDG